MPKHERNSQEEARFYPVDGIRGYCSCGEYFNYIGREGEVECSECERVWNVYVDHDLWQERE